MKRLFMSIFLKLFYPCREVAELASLSFDRQLNFLQRIRVRVHVAMCRSCILHARQLQALRTLLHDKCKEAENDTCLFLPPEKKEKIKECLRSAK